MSLNSYNNIKNKWIYEYLQLKQNLKDEELNLLKFFLVKNYHLNKVYKKYVYKEIALNDSYYQNNYKKIKTYLNDLKKSNLNNNSNNNIIQKKKFQNLVLSIKNESNKKYELLLKEEKQIENDLKLFDKEIMEEYDKDFDVWVNETENIINNPNNNNIISENNNDINNYKEDEISTFLNIMDKKKKNNLKYRTINIIKNFKSENNKLNNKIESKTKINYGADNKKIKNLIGNLNIKKNKENIIRLTANQIPKKFISIFDDSEDLLQKEINNIIKEIDNINNTNISNINTNNTSSKTINSFSSKNTILNEEKNMISNINIFLNKINEDNKNLSYLEEKIKYINSIIKQKMGGIYLGWRESEHNEFLVLKNFYIDQSNSFIFLTSLNNLFPYMDISMLKKHIKLYDIFLKIDKIKKLLIEKYNQLKNKYDINKSRISKLTSTSITKSSISNKGKIYKNSYNKFNKSFDFEGKSIKSLYQSSNSKYFDLNYKNKSNEYLKTNFNRKVNYNINRFKKNKDKIFENKNYSSITLNYSKNRSFKH